MVGGDINDDDVNACVNVVTCALPVADVKMELINTETNKDETLKKTVSNHHKGMAQHKAGLCT